MLSKINDIKRRIQIYWINTNDPRALYTQFSLILLSTKKKFDYYEISRDNARDFGISDDFLNKLGEGISCFIFKLDTKNYKIIIDNSDGCFHLSPLIFDADIYFCGPFNTAFHVDKEWIPVYKWQLLYDLSEWEKKSKELIQIYGEHFCKIKKYIPMQMHMFPIFKKYKLGKLYNHIIYRWENFLFRFNIKTKFYYFNKRYNNLLLYRKNKLKYDIVILDTLWAWPPHRVKLHQELNRLSQNYKIINRLIPADWNATGWRKFFSDHEDPVTFIKNLNRPLQLEDSFEKMLASSKLCTFATGKHWGWRQIMFIALLCGLPVLMDKPLYEPYFSFDKFEVFYNDNEWDDVLFYLEQIDQNKWYKIKEHNQRIFEQYLSPESVGNYILRILLENLS